MATVNPLTPNDFTQISWVSTGGNVVTFRLQTLITLASGDLCVRQSASHHSHANFSTDVPELHFHIENDASGSQTIALDETISVTMDNINQPVSILLVVKEGDEIKRETVYKENPAEIERPIEAG